MNKILFIISAIYAFSNILSAENVTMKYGGDWTKTTVIQNDSFMSMAGSFVGTNVMMMGEEKITTNFVCTGLYQTEPAAILIGSCNMKQAGTNDFWVLNWKCSVTGSGQEDCKGNVVGGTGKFKKASGKLAWTDVAGFGEGGGTFNIK